MRLITEDISHPLKLRVLIAEDDPDQSDLLRECLERDGYTVEAVFSGDVALRRLSGKNYAAAIMDVRMPGLNGGAVLKLCRINSPPVTTPMVIVSAFASEKDRKEFAKDGASAFFAKPYEIFELLKKIRELVSGDKKSDAAM